MTAADHIAEALRQHHDVRELHLDGTKTYHCEKCCGGKRCLSHSLAEHIAHQAESILDALGAAGYTLTPGPTRCVPTAFPAPAGLISGDCL
jgi:hypothetical protein